MLGAMSKAASKPSAVIDTRVIYCGDNLEQLRKLPDACVELVYIDPPFNSNRNYEVFWGETKEKRAFEDATGAADARGARLWKLPGSCRMLLQKKERSCPHDSDDRPRALWC